MNVVSMDSLGVGAEQLCTEQQLQRRYLMRIGAVAVHECIWRGEVVLYGVAVVSGV